MRQTIQWAAHRQEEKADPFPPLPAHIALAVFDGSAVPSPVGYPWDYTCQSCEDRILPTTVAHNNLRQCRLCRTMTVLLRRQRRVQEWGEVEWCREMLKRLWQRRENWFRWTEREWARHHQDS